MLSDHILVNYSSMKERKPPEQIHIVLENSMTKTVGTKYYYNIKTN